MTEEELINLGFFQIEPNPEIANDNVRQFQLYEYYKGVFVRIIITMQKGDFFLEYVYFNSLRANELQMELFGNDLSVENIIMSLKVYRESIDPSEELPETF